VGGFLFYDTPRNSFVTIALKLFYSKNNQIKPFGKDETRKGDPIMSETFDIKFVAELPMKTSGRGAYNPFTRAFIDDVLPLLKKNAGVWALICKNDPEFENKRGLIATGFAKRNKIEVRQHTTSNDPVTGQRIGDLYARYIG
jgi:hypothetical protein